MAVATKVNAGISAYGLALVAGPAVAKIDAIKAVVPQLADTMQL
jgi:hypothetical protein